MIHKINFITIILAGCFISTFSESKKNIGDIISYHVDGNSVFFNCAGNEVIKLDIVSRDVVRLRMAPNGKFATSLSVKFGFVKEALAAARFTTEKREGELLINTGMIDVQVFFKPFGLKIYNNAKKLIFSQSASKAMSYVEYNYLNID
ncbi:MAG: DUF4968 domain-containing protein, partial [Chitinophagaceae bacterium]|nr:DUF4968 domain-containing protein [Chitinophagaceae bacterium]